MRATPLFCAGLAAALFLAGCTGSGDGGGPADASAGSSPDDAVPVTVVPSASPTLVADTDAGAASVSMSRALFTS